MTMTTDRPRTTTKPPTQDRKPTPARKPLPTFRLEKKAPPPPPPPAQLQGVLAMLTKIDEDNYDDWSIAEFPSERAAKALATKCSKRADMADWTFTASGFELFVRRVES